MTYVVSIYMYNKLPLLCAVVQRNQLYWAILAVGYFGLVNQLV